MTIEEILQNNINTLDSIKISDASERILVKLQVEEMRYILSNLPQFILNLNCPMCNCKCDAVNDAVKQ